MRHFPKLIAPVLIAAMGLGVAAAPAQAQPIGHNAGRPTPVRSANIRADINSLNQNIDRAAARRTVSGREATGLKRDAAQVRRLYASYARNGLTRAETQTLQRRVDGIQAALRAERHDRDNRRH
jgi:hypothetical protein